MFSPDAVEAVEALIAEEVERRLAQPERLLLTVPEFAAKIGLSTASVYRHISLGRIPVVRIGGRVLVRSGEVERLNGDQPPWSVPNGRELVE